MRKVVIIISFLIIPISLAAFLVLIEKPTPTTELYFTSEIPKEIKIGEPYTVNFTVHNLENTDVLYNYEVKIFSGDTEKNLANNNFILENKEFKNISEDFILDEEFKGKKIIIVNLYYNEKSQQIYFSSE